MLSTLYLAVTEAFRSLAANKMRSFLTILGIVIGVAAVIALLALGQGTQKIITENIESLGTNLLFIAPGNPQQEVVNIQPFTLDEVDALRDPVAAPSLQYVVPSLQRSEQVRVADTSHVTTLVATTPEYQVVRKYGLLEGQFFTQEHMLAQAAVAVIGPDLAKILYDRDTNVVGETLFIRGYPFRVIGVLEYRGSAGFGQNLDDRVIIPLTTAYARLYPNRRREVDIIMASAVSPDRMDQAKEEIRQILRLRRHLRPDQEDDFTIFTQQQFLNIFQSITSVLTIFLGGIAAISLLVGGIGIMNIMLVSVTERTREIGLRKALGARKQDIRIQFLVEAITLSLVGGVFGIFLGWGIAKGVEGVAARFDTELPAVITLNAVLLATLFSAAVGVFFGYYPANRAANLEPVEALRYE